MDSTAGNTPSRPLIALVLASVLVWPALGSAQPVLYTIQDLGSGVTGGGPLNPITLAINSSGQVAGTYFLPGGGNHAFRTTPTGVISDPGADLGELGNGQSVGMAINSSGQVSGFSPVAGIYHVFRTTPTGNLSDPGADLGLTGIGGYGINATGQVTGGSPAYRSSPNGQPVNFTVLGTLASGTVSAGIGINDAGQVTGLSTIAGNSAPYHAFRTTATGLVSDPGTDLGTLGGANSAGYAINASGQVTGASDTSSGAQHVFRTTATGLVSDPGTDLGPGAGYGINALGVLVGSSGGHAFVYDTQMRDLNQLLINGSGWILTSAFGINDAGQIAGVGTFGGSQHAFRLTPGVVPEPSALILLGVAAASGMLARWRQFGAAGRKPTPSLEYPGQY